MQRLIRNVLEYVARSYKGAHYELDKNADYAALLLVARTRLMGIVRCVIRGIAFRPNRLLFVGPNVELRNRKHIRFGKGVTLGKSVTIDGLSREGVEIGRSVNIGPYTIIEASGSIRDLGKGIRIGARTGIGGFSFIGGAGGVVIGEDVIMGQWVSFGNPPEK